MPIKFISGDSKQLEDQLNGTYRSGPFHGLWTNWPTLPTKTLVFLEPAVTVTFTAGAVTLDDAVDEIRSQLAAVDPGIRVEAQKYVEAGTAKPDRYYLAITPSSGPGITLSHTGTANDMFKISTEAGHSSLKSTRHDPSTIVAFGDRHPTNHWLLLDAGSAGAYATDLGARLESEVVSAGPAEITSLQVHNDSGGALYFQLHDRATALAGAEVPKFSFAIADGATVDLGPVVSGQRFSSGITYGWSTTIGTYTEATSDAGIVYLKYLTR